MNITTRTTIVSNIQLDDNIRVRLLEKEGFKSTPEAWKCWRRNNEATKYERMTPVLRSLHSLPVRQQIAFKTAVTVYKCLHGLAPPYLTEHCTTSDAGRRHLRSANTRQLVIPRTRTSYSDRSFSVRGTVCHTICGLRTPRWTLSRTNWKHFCLTLECRKKGPRK